MLARFYFIPGFFKRRTNVREVKNDQTGFNFESCIGYCQRGVDENALGTCLCLVVAWFELCDVLSGSGKVSIVN